MKDVVRLGLRLGLHGGQQEADKYADGIAAGEAAGRRFPGGSLGRLRLLARLFLLSGKSWAGRSGGKGYSDGGGKDDLLHFTAPCFGFDGAFLATLIAAVGEPTHRANVRNATMGKGRSWDAIFG